MKKSAFKGALDQPELIAFRLIPGYAHNIKPIVYCFLFQTPNIQLRRCCDTSLLIGGNRRLWPSSIAGPASLHFHERQNGTIPCHQIQLARSTTSAQVPRDDCIADSPQIPIGEPLTPAARFEVQGSWPKSAQAFTRCKPGPLSFSPNQSMINDLRKKRHDDGCSKITSLFL